MVKRFLLLILILVGGCMPRPGDIYVTQSQFDGSTEISMDPAWVCQDNSHCFIKMGLMRNTNMPPDEIILTAIVRDGGPFAGGENLKFNIDGAIVPLESIDSQTSFDISTHFAWSSKRYRINKAFLEQLLRARRVVVKISLQQSYVEGIFSTDGPIEARNAFREFYKRAIGEL